MVSTSFEKMRQRCQGDQWAFVPKTNAALPLWTSTDNFLSRYMQELSSPVVCLRRLLRSLRNCRVRGLKTPKVSTAFGAKE